MFGIGDIKKTHYSIRTKISIGLFLMALMVSLTMSITGLLSLKQSLIEETRDHLHSVVQLQERRIQDFLTLTQDRTNLVASRTQLRRSLKQQLETPAAEHVERMGRILRDALKSIPDFRAIHILNREQRIVASTDPDQLGLERRPVRKGESSQQIYIAADQSVMISMMKPLLLSGEHLGSLWIESAATGLKEISSDYFGLGYSGETVLGQRMNQDEVRFLSQLRYDPSSGSGKGVNVQQDETPIVRAVQGIEGFHEDVIDYRGVEVFVYTLPLPYLQLGMLVKIDQSEALVAYHDQFTLQIKLIVLFLILGLLVSIPISRTISRPIEKLTQIVRRIHQGERNLRVDYDADNFDSETEQLARTFNGLTDEMVGTFEAAPSGMVIADADGIIVRCNRELYRIFGYEDGELEGKAVEALLPHRVRHQHVGHRADYKKQPEMRAMGGQMELKALRANGTEFPVEVGLAPIEGSKMLTLATVVDITERQELYQSNLEARQQAEEATRTKSDFLANMSHEIRTPMNAIVGFTYLALQQEIPLKVRDQLQKIELSARTLLQIINDILDYSKIEAGKLVIEEVPFHLDEVLDNLVATASVLSRNKDIEIMLYRDSKLPGGYVGDPLRLGQVLNNLLSNAIKFTDQGMVTIRVHPVEEISLDSDKAVLRFDIEDSGIGMSREAIAKLFQPFQQADSSTTRKYGGTGLGLTIVGQLVEQMGGTVEVKSQEGQGSTFTVRLPLSVSKRVVNYRHYDRSVFEKLRVLVVEDSEPMRELTEQMVRQFGCSCVSCSSGEEAIELARQGHENGKPFDFLLVDWRLPGVNGIDASRQILAMCTERRPVIILETAYGHELLRSQHGEADVDALLTKPVTASSLYDTMVQLMDTSQMEESSPAADTTDPHYLSGMRLLLVEDNEINQEVATSMLESVGAVVEIADNGLEAVERLAERGSEFDVVLMDLQMPVMDGIEATRKIRQNHELDALPIVALTANATSKDRERCLQAGMDDYLSKPVNPQDVYRTLGRWHVDGEGGETAPEFVSDEKDEGVREEGREEVLNLELALSRLNQDRPRLLRLLQRFQLDLESKLELTIQRLDEGQGHEAKRLVHGLKGVSGNLAAEPVYRAASRLESALDTGERVEQTLAEFEQVSEQLKQAMPQFVALLEEEKTSGPAAAEIPSAQLLQEFRVALESSDFDAVAKLDQLLEGMEEKQREEMKAVVDATQGFLFDEALEALDKVTKLGES